MEISDRFLGYLPVVVHLQIIGVSKSENPTLGIAGGLTAMSNRLLLWKTTH
jgi:hypothetical protein